MGLVPAVKKLSSNAIDAGENNVEVSKLLLYDKREISIYYYASVSNFSRFMSAFNECTIKVTIKVSLKLHIADEIVIELYFWIY